MKFEGGLFVGCAIFFGVVNIIYWYFSKDPTGTTALALSVALAFLTGFYLLFTGRRLPLRPEDTPDGEIEEGTGELGFFSPHSWWPLYVGLAAATRGLRGGYRLVAVPDRAAGDLPHRDRLRLRVLPRRLGPLVPAAGPISQAGQPPWFSFVIMT